VIFDGGGLIFRIFHKKLEWLGGRVHLLEMAAEDPHPERTSPVLENSRKKELARIERGRLGCALPMRGIDKGIAREVGVLRANGVETTESCQGGQGHPYPEPTVRFCGGHAEGFKALGIALQNGLLVTELRRIWCVIDGEPTGPQWEMTFHHPEGAGCRSVERNKAATWRWR